MNERSPIDISMPASAFEVQTKPPFTGTMTVVYPDSPEAGLSAKATKNLHEIDLLQAHRLQKVERFAPYLGVSIVIDISKNQTKQITSRVLLDILGPLSKAVREGNKVSQQVVPPRLLIRTRENGAYGDDDYPALTVDAVELLYAEDFGLVGIDTPWIDPPDGTNRISYLFGLKQMVWLCNINLDKCRSGTPYLLNALPLFDVDHGPVPARPVVVPIFT